MGQFSEQYGKYQFTAMYGQEGETLAWNASVLEEGRLVATRGGRLHAREGQAPFGEDDVRVAVQDSIDKRQEYRQQDALAQHTDSDE